MDKLITADQTRLSPDVIHVVEKQEDRLFRNPRLSFQPQALGTLEKSIADIGLMKPLLVKPKSDQPGHFELVAGERRLRCIRSLIKKKAACRIIGTDETDVASKVYAHIPVVIVNPANDLEQLQYAVAENLEAAQVPDWDILMLALEMDGRTNPDGSKMYEREDLCKVFNKSPTWISHTLSLTNLPESAKVRLQNGTLSRTAAIRLLSAKPEMVDAVLKKSEQIVKAELNRDIAEADSEADDAILMADIAEEESKLALENGDYVLAKMQTNMASSQRRKATTARSRSESAKERLARGEIPAEAVDRAMEDTPNAMKEGVARKARSPKFLRQSLDEYSMLVESSDGDVIHHEAGTFEKSQVELVLLGVNWTLGGGGNCLLQYLKEKSSTPNGKGGKTRNRTAAKQKG